MSLSIMGGILAIKLNSILEVSAGSIKKVGPGPKYWRSNTNVTLLYVNGLALAQMPWLRCHQLAWAWHSPRIIWFALGYQSA
jgi:hypothetical protein